MSYEKYSMGLLSVLEQNFITENIQIWHQIQKLQKDFAYKGTKKRKETQPGWHMDETGYENVILERTSEYFT
jgi:hypothetical protein